MPPKKKDLAMERYIKSMRALNLETKAATEYPDKREELLAEIAQLRAEVKELDVEIKKETRAAIKAVKDTAIAYALAREAFLRLRLGPVGYDDGLTIPPGYRVGAGHVREALVAVLDSEPAEPPRRQLSEEQARHEMRRRNELAGKGYVDDKDVGRDPLKDFGLGGRLVPGFTAESGRGSN